MAPSSDILKNRIIHYNTPEPSSQIREKLMENPNPNTATTKHIINGYFIDKFVSHLVDEGIIRQPRHMSKKPGKVLLVENTWFRFDHGPKSIIAIEPQTAREIATLPFLYTAKANQEKVSLLFTTTSHPRKLNSDIAEKLNQSQKLTGNDFVTYHIAMIPKDAFSRFSRRDQRTDLSPIDRYLMRDENNRCVVLSHTQEDINRYTDGIVEVLT